MTEQVTVNPSDIGWEGILPCLRTKSYLVRRSRVGRLVHWLVRHFSHSKMVQDEFEKKILVLPTVLESLVVNPIGRQGR